MIYYMIGLKPDAKLTSDQRLRLTHVALINRFHTGINVMVPFTDFESASLALELMKRHGMPDVFGLLEVRSVSSAFVSPADIK